MLTNPNWNVHNDYIVTDVFKPAAANQLVTAIPYDYVITQDMLDWGAENATTTYGIDIAKVLNHGDSPDTTGMTAKLRISIMLDCATTAATELNFRNLTGSPWFTTGQGTNTLDIYSRTAFTFTGRNATTYIHNGYGNVVKVSDNAVATSTLYVGVFTADSDIPWSGTFIYEDAQGTHAPTGSNVSRRVWMTNRVPLLAEDVDELLPEVMIEYDAATPVSSNYSAVQAVLGAGYSPVIYKDVTEYKREIYHLSMITQCGFEFTDVSNNRKHYLCTWTASDVQHCEWDATDGYPTPAVPDECVIVPITYNAGSHQWSSDVYTAAQITQLINGANPKKIVLKAEQSGMPIIYCYNMESLGSDTYRWNTLYTNLNTGEVDLLTYTIDPSSVSLNITIVKSPA